MRCFVGLVVAALSLTAAEYHGAVKSGGLPIPGATVSAIKGDKKLVTTTDEQGAYSFPDLEAGAWTVTVEMLGFALLTRTVEIEQTVAGADWDLKLLPPQSLLRQSATGERPRRNAAPAGEPGAGAQSAGPSEAGGGRGFPRRNGGAQSGPPGRPPLGRGTAQKSSYQALEVNPSQEPGALQTDNLPEQDNETGPSSGDLSQSASSAFVVNGSVSSGVNAPEQNDWMLFRAGVPGGFGPGGPGGPAGFGPGGFASPDAAQAGGAGASGPGGPGGAGGPGFGGGRFGGGRGFPGRGRAGRGGLARNGANSFGNARRNRRSQYNGNVAVILDNSALDAKPFSLTGQNTPKSAYNHFRSTGALGGPLKIPKLLSGERTFFFLNYQLTLNHNANVLTGLVPTAEERAGIFPGLGAIPISPQAQALLNFYPLPNFSGGSRYNYQIPVLGLGNQSNLNARVSQTIDSRNQLSGNFSWQYNHTTAPNLFGFADTSTMTGFNTGLQWTHHFSTTLISNLRYTFSRSAAQATPFFANTQNVSQNAGIQGNDQAPSFYGPPSLSFSNGISGLSDGNFSSNHNTTNQAGESLIWVHGKHNLTLGGDFRRLDFNQLSQQNPRGSFLFNGEFTGNAFADFLLGFPATSSIAYGNADKYFRTSWIDTFANDDWRIKSNLTINFGLRWDFQQPVSELYNRLVNLNIGPDFTSAAPVCATASSGCLQASQVGYPDSLVRPNYREFQPRIGIAWRPLTGHSTVVRAGYGLYYNTSVYQSLATWMAQQAPLSYSVTQPNSLTNPFTLADAFLTPAINSIAQTYAIDPDFRLGYIHYWQASIQQNLSPSILLTLNYQGNKGTRQVQEFLPNTFPAGAPPSPYPSGYVYVTSNGNSTYNAASVQLQRRFRSGFSWNARYIFSKALDDAQGVGGRASMGSSYAQNWLDLAAERSLSSFNRTHTLNGTLQYSTGQGVGGGTLLSGWKGALAKDWTFATTLTVGSGLPETPIVLSRVATGTGVNGTLRADYIGGSLAAVLPGYGFNAAAFAAPQPGEYGNAGRNIITGPIQLNLNASAGRVFRLGERRSLDIRLDSTNVMNHVTFSSWNTTLGSAQFGLPVAANAMRSMQLTLRFRF